MQACVCGTDRMSGDSRRLKQHGRMKMKLRTRNGVHAALLHLPYLAAVKGSAPRADKAIQVLRRSNCECKRCNAHLKSGL